jgi:hypothetical protein
MTLFAHRNDMTISLLIYPNDAPDKRWGDDLDEKTLGSPRTVDPSKGRRGQPLRGSALRSTLAPRVTEPG